MSSPHDPFPHTCPTTPPQSHRPCVAPWHLVQGSNCKSRGRLIHTAQSTVGSMRVSSAVVEQSPCHPPPIPAIISVGGRSADNSYSKRVTGQTTSVLRCVRDPGLVGVRRRAMGPFLLAHHGVAVALILTGWPSWPTFPRSQEVAQPVSAHALLSPRHATSAATNSNRKDCYGAEG